MREHLTNAVQDYVRRTRVRLHVPAHGGGSGNPALDGLWPGLAPWDVTEQPELDDLSHPEGPLLAAQREAASFFGAAAAYFLTGGATLGVQASIMGAIGDKGTLLLARDSHRSALGALVLAAGEGVLVDPERDPQHGVSLGLDPHTVSRALSEHPDIRAILVTYPTYLGVTPRLREIADIAHRRGVWVIADAAHGAHFGLHPDLPPSALAEGADLAVLGMHKTGGALTQTALLLAGPQIDQRTLSRVELALRLLQSSSPSYLLMVSIEQAISEMARGAAGLGCAIEAGIRIMSPARVRTALPQDPLRVGLRCQSPADAAALTERLAQLGVHGEYREGAEALFIIPWGQRDLAFLRDEVECLAAPGPANAHEPQPTSRVRPRDALFSSRRQIGLMECEGCVAADIVGIVPPGIPALWPGERISKAAVRKLMEAERAGHRIMGIENHNVWVVAE